MSDIDHADFERLLAELEGRLDPAERRLLHEDLARDPLLRAELARLALDRVLVSELLLEEQEAAVAATPVCDFTLMEAAPARRTVPAFAFASSALAAAAVLIGLTAFLAPVAEQPAPVAAGPRAAAPLVAKAVPAAPVLETANAAPKIVAMRDRVTALETSNHAPVIRLVKAPVALAIAEGDNHAPKILELRMHGSSPLLTPEPARTRRLQIQPRASESVLQLKAL